MKEPVGGAHRNKEEILKNVKNSIQENLNFFENMSRDEILNHRKNKFLSIGRAKGFNVSSNEDNSLIAEKSNVSKYKNLLGKNYIYLIVVLISILALFIL